MEVFFIMKEQAKNFLNTLLYLVEQIANVTVNLLKLVWSLHGYPRAVQSLTDVVYKYFW